MLSLSEQTKTMKTIFIIANFTRPFNGIVDGRFLFLAEELTKRDNVRVELITSSFSHGTKKQKPVPKQEEYKTKITFCHEPGYIKHAGLKRLWSHHVWGKNVTQYVKSLPKPDCIYCAIPSLTAAVEMAKYCEQNHIRYIVDVQDLWPEATFMVIKNKLLRSAALPMTWFVYKAYSKADAVVAVSQTYVDRVLSVNTKSKGNLAVFLGNDGSVFDRKRVASEIDTSKNIRLCYVGSMSASYDIKCAIDAIAIVNGRGNLSVELEFVLMGDGPMRTSFEDYAKKKNVYCDFRGRQPYDQMVAQMCECDIMLNPIVKGSAASIINKVGDYALSGRPVINTQECQEYRDLIDTYHCGINCAVGHAEQVANAIITLANDATLRQEMGDNHRRLGNERFDRRNTYQQIVNLVLE